MTASQESEPANPSFVTKRLSPAQRQAEGKALRQVVPRSAHGEWQPAADRPDPIDLLEASNQGWISELVPIRYGRMLESPFAFFRGAAIVMAADLATTPTTGIRVQACGDCHLLNFGLFDTPEGNLVFDLNDFDETLPAPWEWDVKRLVASIVLAGRHIGLAEKISQEAALMAACSYRQRMAEYAQMRTLEVWYARLDAETLIDLARSPQMRQRRLQMTQKSRTRTIEHIFPRLTDAIDGQRRIIDAPPLLYHPSHDGFLEGVLACFDRYRESLPDDRRVLLDRYRLVDIAMKVVGIGSVGTPCAVALLMADDNDLLFLQVKEARASILEPYAGKSVYQNHGQRVVNGQRLMQAANDLFLGWASYKRGHDFYLRQLRDMKGSVNIEAMSATNLIDYAELCGWALARAHARSGDAAIVSGYLGKSDAFDRAVVDFAVVYADRTERDRAALVAAVQSGRLEAEKD